MGSNRPVYIYMSNSIKNGYFAPETLATFGRDMSFEGKKYYGYIVHS
jgi:hypothetical protein